MEACDHVHAKRGFTDGPEPVTLCKTGLGQKGRLSQGDVDAPMGFNKLILGLHIGGRSVDVGGALEYKELVCWATKEFVVEVELKDTWEPNGVNKEAGKVFETIASRLSAKLVNQHEAVTVATRADAIAITDINANTMEDGSGTGKMITGGVALRFMSTTSPMARFRFFRENNPISHLKEHRKIAKLAVQLAHGKRIGGGKGQKIRGVHML